MLEHVEASNGAQGSRHSVARQCPQPELRVSSEAEHRREQEKDAGIPCSV